MTTDKNKEQFDKWYNVKFRFDLISSTNPNNYIVSTTPPIDSFYRLPFEMQIGVYLAYYDSLGIDIDVNQEELTFNQAGIYINNKELREKIGLSVDVPGSWKTRNEAYKEAFKKADTLINEN